MGWTVQQPPDSQARPAPRGGLATVQVGKRIICFGGADRVPKAYADIWVLQPGAAPGSQYEWTKVSPVSIAGGELQARAGCSISAVGDIIYIYGGQDPTSQTIFDDILALDTNTWNWTPVEVPGPRPPARHSHCAGVVNGRNIIVFGGAGLAGILGDLWVFDSFAQTWTHLSYSGAPPGPREMHSGTMVGDAQLLVYGGRSASGQVLSEASVFDCAALRWRGPMDTPFPRCAHAAVAVPAWAARQPGERAAVLVFGGYEGARVEGSLLRIDPEVLTAAELEPGAEEPRGGSGGGGGGGRPRPRFAHAMAAVGAGSSLEVVVIAGVTPAADLNDVAVWRPEGPPPAAQPPEQEEP